MAILIKPIQKVNPKDPEAAPKWYITQVTTNQAEREFDISLTQGVVYFYQ